MAEQKQTTGTADFYVENVGGIDSARVSLPPGVTLLTGENATNRTSFLQAVTAALGSERATLKADADEGTVRMELAGETYQRRLERTGDSVTFSGDSYLQTPVVADLFAFLFENNEARRSVAQGRDLRDLIMRPVSTEEIRDEIERLEQEKDRIDEEMAEIQRERDRLPKLEARKSELTETIAEKRATLEEKEAEIAERSRDIDESREQKQVLESKLGALSDVRSELETVRGRIEKQKESISSLKEERAELRAELDDLETDPAEAYDEIQTRLDELRAQRKRLSTEVSELQNLIQYNERQLEEDGSVLRTDDAEEAESITGQLVEDGAESVVCWTCGSHVQPGQIADTVGRLEELRSRKMGQLTDTKDQLQSLKSRQQERERLQRTRKEIREKLSDIDAEIEQRETQVASLADRRTELTEEIERLEAEIETLESEDFESVLELHREANQLEFEIDSIESDRADVVERIEEIEQSVSELDSLQEKRDRVAAELTEQRTKIDRFEAEAVEAFNDHMSAILDRLGYDNIDRIWIERLEETVRDGRKKVEKTRFELHIVRSTDNGTAFEDTIAHLSESEREVTGLIFALAGYLVHDLHDPVPFMLLDSLEAIDSDRIAALVEYFSEYAEYLVVALLEEDAQALSDSYHRVREI